MNITININIPAIENLASAILALSGNRQIVQGVEAKSITSEKQKNQPKKEKPVKQADVQAEVEVKPENNKSEKGPDETTEKDQHIPTVVELRAKAQEKGTSAEGKKAIKDLLNKFDSKSISKVLEKDRAAFMKELEAL